ncbi:MAG: CheY-like chemotaxis protein [bacterium]|jgi:CheY-like chemotaxis protein
MLTRRLKRFGYEIVSAENGQVGVELAEKEQPNLILMDMHMPILDGYTATKTLRKRGYQGLIVALTASAMTHEISRPLEAGCDDVILKPIDIDFEKKIKQLLESSN